MKILVIQQKMIGDVLTSTILFEALRKKFPSAELHYLVNLNTKPVLKNNPFIDKIILTDEPTKKNELRFFDLLKHIHNESYEVVIDVYAKISSAMITKFSGAKMRIGYQKNYTSFLYTHTFQRLKKPEHDASLALENRLKLLKPLGIDFDFITPKIYLTPEEVSTARNSLDKSGLNLELPLVMVSILGSNPKKTYPGSFMAELLDFCVEKKQGIQFLFNYIPNQKTEVKAIYKQLNPVTQNQVFFDIFGKSLREYMALTARCTAVFGNEGGANNIAKALEIPTFSIFSPNLTKVNWFGKSEEKKHTAVHLADYMDFNKNDKKAAVENPELYYAKFKPELIKPELERFLSEVSKL